MWKILALCFLAIALIPDQAKGAGNATIESGSFPNRRVYDEQLGMTFASTFSRLDFNVSAVAQDSIACEGPAYLLNGLSDMGYWYQTGIAWRWSGLQTGPLKFDFLYEVWGPNDSSIFPSTGRTGLENLSVDPGDIVLLSLYLLNGDVTMSAHDWITGASRSVVFNAHNATQFLGLYPPLTTDGNGYFTGLITEQFHDSPFYGAEQEVTYSSTTFQSSIGNLWIQEQNGTNANPRLNPPLFAVSNYSYQASEATPLSLSSKGGSETFDGRVFTTGLPGVRTATSDCNEIYWILLVGYAVLITGVILMGCEIFLNYRALKRNRATVSKPSVGEELVPSPQNHSGLL